MKKYLLIVLVATSLINAETGTALSTFHEWNPQEYTQGNQIQISSALHFLQKYNIDLTNKKVLDIGCRTGNISAIIAQEAHSVHGIDSSRTMIDYANNSYAHISNLSFENARTETFTTNELYDAAVSFFSLHWLTDKQSALEHINAALKADGILFCALHTDKEPTRITVIRKMIPLLQEHSFFDGEKLLETMLSPKLPAEECKQLLNNTGFELIACEHESVQYVKTREEIEQFQKPIIMGFSIIQSMPEDLQKWFFKTYMDLFLGQLPYNNDGSYLYTAHATLFHARKVS